MNISYSKKTNNKSSYLKMVSNQKYQEVKEVNSVKKYGYGIRHLQIATMTLCMLNLFLGRSVMAVAVLAMTDTSRRNDTNIEIYDWDKETQGLILSSFFWGYMTMQIPAGLLAKRYGGKSILLVALVANGVLCLALPTLVYYGGWISVCLCRVCMGLTQSCLFPASHTLIGRWAPSSEITSFTSIVYAGNSLGTIIAMPVSGLLAETALGWKMIFYATGGLMLATAFIWYWFSSSTPAEHRWISQEEKEYIEAELNSGHTSQQKRATPWRALFRTMPLWAILATHWGTAIAFTMVFVDLPTYLDKAMQISLKNSAILSALPYLGMCIGGVVSGTICDKLYNKKILSLVTLRKLFNSIAHYGVAIGFVIIAFLDPAHKVVAVAVVVVMFTLFGSIHSGFMANYLDLSPQFAGVLLSINGFVAASGSVITPVLTGIILRNDPSNISNWRIVFLLIASLVALASTFYNIFGSADRVSWDDVDSDDKEASIDEMKPLKEKKLQEEIIKK